MSEKPLRLAMTRDRRILVGLSLALMASLAYSISQIIGRKIVTELAPPLTASAFGLLFGNIALLIISHKHLHHIPSHRKSMIFMILAGLASGAGATSMLFSLSLAPVVLVAPIASVTPLIVLGLSFLFIRRLELITRRVIIGTCLVVGGVVLVVIESNI